jgi:hypothetical protein
VGSESTTVSEVKWAEFVRKHHMADATLPIRVASASDLAHALDTAALWPVLVEKDGVLYRIDRVDVDDVWVDYDPSAIRAAIAATAGSWANIDAEELKTRLARAREEGTRAE